MIVKKIENLQQNNFRIGDEVIDIITNSIGIITKINYKYAYPIVVHFKDNKGNKCITAYTKEGKKNTFYDNPQLLHYIKGFHYYSDIINFKNLPKRQKTWKNYMNYIKYSIKQIFVNF